MTKQRLIRWFVLIFTVAMALAIYIHDLLNGYFNLLGAIVLLVLFMIPSLTYFFITIKVRSLLVLLLPAVLLCVFKGYVDYIYFVSESSTTAIMFIFTPFYEVIIVLGGLGIGFVLQWIINRFRARQG